MIKIIKKETRSINKLIANLKRCKKTDDIIKVTVLAVIKAVYVRSLVLELVRLLESIIDYLFPHYQKNQIKGLLLEKNP